MRGFRGGIGLGSLIAGIMSFKHVGLPNFFERPTMPTPFAPPKVPRKIKRRPARVHRGWTPNFYGTAKAGSREAKRRQRQGAYYLQRASHKPPAIQPRHIFGA